MTSAIPESVSADSDGLDLARLAPTGFGPPFTSVWGVANLAFRDGIKDSAASASKRTAANSG